MSTMPPPPGFKKPDDNTNIGPESDSRLSQDETSYILRKTLLPEHAIDPNILRFINRYLICRDARQAARDIGLNPLDGVHLRKRPDIFECIRQLTEKALMKYGYDAAEVVEKVREIAFVDPADLERPDGTYYESLQAIPPEVRRAIKKMKVKNEYGEDPNGMKVMTGKIIEIEFWDKMKAVELLGREKDIFKQTTKIEHDVTQNMADTLLESRERAQERRASQARLVTTHQPIDVTPDES